LRCISDCGKSWNLQGKISIRSAYQLLVEALPLCRVIIGAHTKNVCKLQSIFSLISPHSFLDKLILLFCQMYRGVQSIITRLMLEKGIKVLLNTEIEGVETYQGSKSADFQKENVSAPFLVASDGRKFSFHEAICCTNACAQTWLRESGMMKFQCH